ncbi:MAG TPA: bifunctional isocitrate dehydrogenase kinase/phosphatase [Quisquiliibacterium sp.]|nr:bifunctional isocitrate dehydrogenase kinase/phosphatase [Quisquiliibacterium sp.]HQN11471.1 bifunctional isocitrate dehydrogenase kinase/phosphatase [Quisquiliibacterium sp.]HQP65525.1 bifunctional isocitrate dehydrogenase kinase/phosphatase [Quisquiliibacterium sp.]
MSKERARSIAEAILAGFDRHYGLFRYNAQQAKTQYELGRWHTIRRLARERIAFYDQRVLEAVRRMESEFRASDLDGTVWPDVKRHYVNLLAEHRQPELAETFFNSVCTKILHREYFRNDIIFVRPAVSTEYLDGDPPSFRVYYPTRTGWTAALRQVIIDVGFACPFVDFERDLRLVRDAARAQFEKTFVAAIDCQIQVLRTPFFRNKGCYLIGRFINDGELVPFAIPILQDSQGRLYIDTVLFGGDRIEALFNFSRAYFMVDMNVPSAYVQFLKTLMPTKPESELYTMLGLHKQGKTMFYRDLLHHLRHSTDQFVIAPGIKGLVMAVFTLPSFPYVFKIIKDKRRKEMTREFIQGQYQLVKFHDRVGRMADTWEYSDVSFPRARIDAALMAELKDVAPSIVHEEGDRVVIRHVYIERRMVPLNIYLERADALEREHAVIEYGDAIKQMVAANIFPGDMLYKNFGVTRQNRVVFYDYDEVAYLTDCNFRRIPPPRTPEDEMSAEPWYTVGPHDVFPEEFATFLLGDPKVREIFMRHHAELLDAGYWQERQKRIREGVLEDVFPYPDALRFKHRLAGGAQAAA